MKEVSWGASSDQLLWGLRKAGLGRGGRLNCSAFAKEPQPPHGSSRVGNDFSEVPLPVIGCDCPRGGARS